MGICDLWSGHIISDLLKAGKLFETETSWLLYAAIYNVLGYILFLLIARYEAENGYNRISTLMCLNETEEEVLVVLLAMGAALFCGVISASDKNRTVKKVVIDWSVLFLLREFCYMDCFAY